MTAPTKTWEDFTVKYKREVVNGIADTVMSKCSTVDEVQDFLQQVVDRVERKTGNVIPRFSKQETATPMKVEQLDKVMQGPGQLTTTANCTSPRFPLTTWIALYWLLACLGKT